MPAQAMLETHRVGTKVFACLGKQQIPQEQR